MATANYTALIASLESFRIAYSSNECSRNNFEATNLINNSDLTDSEKLEAIKVLDESADHCYGHWNHDGVSELVKYLVTESEKETFTPKVERQNLLELFGNKIVSVSFVKRSTGKARKMVCRVGVTKHLKGGKASCSATEKGLLRVFDMRAKGYRSIPLENVQSVTTRGTCHQFNN